MFDSESCATVTEVEVPNKPRGVAVSRDDEDKFGGFQFAGILQINSPLSFFDILFRT